MESKSLANKVSHFNPDKERASFHALPREIRQKILLDSFTSVINEDVRFNDNIELLVDVIVFRLNWSRSAPHVLAWASTLRSTDAVIASDIGYVVDKALGVLERELWSSERPHWDEAKNKHWRASLVFSFLYDLLFQYTSPGGGALRAGRLMIANAIGLKNSE
ncbi:hypothetical protein FKW77_003551 [Venturia effusa]|uniref:Uncharacterized protein n=1 Tax=Venturia effusa TaxID=50376 RepID=A0A517L2Z7_9PEZI|nr:hypothetical protein FKW77_003551 [Venturia effusa]